MSKFIVCRSFPNCWCGGTWLHWQDRIEELWEDNPPSRGERDAAEIVLYDMLCCIADCDNPAMSRNAQQQLTHPYWERQHRLLRERKAKWHQQ
jgi:hypothetical protein